MAASQLVPVLVLPLVRCPVFCSSVLLEVLLSGGLSLEIGGDLGDFITKSTHQVSIDNLRVWGCCFSLRACPG
jgi:hypothetical protein